MSSSSQNENAILLQPVDRYVNRHIGPSDDDIQQMLESLGLNSLEQLIEEMT